MPTTNWLRLSMLCALLAGCSAPVSTLGPVSQLGDLVEPGVKQATTLAITLRQKAPATKKGYSVQFVRDLDWELADATLTNADGTIPSLNQQSPATLDASNNRTATLFFSPIKPMGGYTLALNLKRKDSGGTYQTVASGTNTNFTLNTGANTITVTLTPTAQGEMLVDVSKPALVLNTATTNVATHSNFSIVRAAGDSIGGNSLGTSPTTVAFKEVSGLDVDSTGNIYVADAGNNQIRRVPTTGGATIVAGLSAGTPGFGGDGGLATSATLSSPRGLTRDPATGNLIFCDTGNNRVRLISNSDGKIVTVAGGGTDVSNSVAYAVNAKLQQPFGICSDQSGNFFITERFTGRVIRIAADGSLTTLTTLTANQVGPIAIDRNNNVLWVADGANVRVITGINGTPSVSGTILFTASGSGTPYINALAFDQVGTLYAEQTGDNATQGAVNTRIYRIPVTTAGQLQASRVAEAIAGTGATGATSGDYSIPTAAVGTATTQLMAGVNWCSLFIDMSAGLSGATVSGILYAGNSYATTYGQISKLTPSAL